MSTKRTNNDAARCLSIKGLRRLQDIWLTDFQTRVTPEGGNAERWFHAVLDLLSERGDEVIPNVLREQEERVINLGKSKEYLSALAEVVQTSPQHNEYDQTVMVLTATPEERAQALQKVLDT